jgi:hypothetical protein
VRADRVGRRCVQAMVLSAVLGAVTVPACSVQQPVMVGASSAAPTASPLSTPAATSAPGAGQVVPRAGEVRVESVELPAEVVDAYLRGGGELASTSSWMDRFGLAGLPVLVGDGVRLVAAELDVRRGADGWRERVGLQWLAQLGAAGSRDAVLDELAHAAGLDGAEPLVPATTAVDGASCEERVFQPVEPSGVRWRVHGCSYPRYPGLVAAGVELVRLGTEPDGGAVEPTATAVAAALGGSVDAVSMEFGRPPTPGSTDSVTVEVTVVAGPGIYDPTLVAAELSAGALDGWSTTAIGGGIRLIGPAGGVWTIESGRAVFHVSGRLES